MSVLYTRWSSAQEAGARVRSTHWRELTRVRIRFTVFQWVAMKAMARSPSTQYEQLGTTEYRLRKYIIIGEKKNGLQHKLTNFIYIYILFVVCSIVLYSIFLFSFIFIFSLYMLPNTVIANLNIKNNELYRIEPRGLYFSLLTWWFNSEDNNLCYLLF